MLATASLSMASAPANTSKEVAMISASPSSGRIGSALGDASLGGTFNVPSKSKKVLENATTRENSLVKRT
jgi:hypothetical protein